uniref:Uncharacterized protein n=1 Tax=Rhizophora mucronata TaxID=61149 RepID=A0A2P2PRN9_RHIMU
MFAIVPMSVIKGAQSTHQFFPPGRQGCGAKTLINTNTLPSPHSPTKNHIFSI